jgi:hypothetical protein
MEKGQSRAVVLGLSPADEVVAGARLIHCLCCIG